MPQKNTIKTFVENSYYHIYNRGVDKRKIFMDDQDYHVFLHLLKFYLSPRNQNLQHPSESESKYNVIRPRPLPNLEKEIDLLAYCLMPNHFHLLVKQKTIDGMSKLLRRVATTYSIYFNKRHQRIGHLFEGPYKAILIDTDAYLLHLSRYIHLNPPELTRIILVNYPYSSYPYYLGKKNAVWVKPKTILSYFTKPSSYPLDEKFKSYQEFVEANQQDPRNAVGTLALD